MTILYLIIAESAFLYDYLINMLDHNILRSYLRYQIIFTLPCIIIYKYDENEKCVAI